jgi:integrase
MAVVGRHEMASIQRWISPRTGKKSFIAQVRVRGRPALRATFPNRKEAKEWAASVETAIREARFHPHLRGARTTFSELVVKYEGSPAFKKLKPSGQAARRQHLKFFVDEWAGLKLSEIQADLVAEARDKLATRTFVRGKPTTDEDGNAVLPKERRRTGGAVNRYLATLSHVFSVAQKDMRLVDRNPVREITKAQEPPGRVRFLSDEERAALLDACESSDWKPLRALVLLALSTGARRGELVQLTWADVDLKLGQAIVHETKNGEPRVLPLVGKALEPIRELKLRNSARSPYVFPHPNGLPEAFYSFDAHWYAALNRAGLQNFRFHDLRHTTASLLAAQGATLLEIADVLGHKTLAMVKRYAHLTTGHKSALIARIAKERGL